MGRSVKKVVLYIALTFVISYSMAGMYVIAGGKTTNVGIIYLALGYMLVPMAVTIIIQKFVYRESLIQPLGIVLKFNLWFFVAWFMPVLIAVATMGISLLIPGVSFTPDMSGFLPQMLSSLSTEQADQVRNFIGGLPVHFFWATLIQALIAGTTVNALFALGEEIGWRGLLLNELGFLGFWKSSAVIGIIWGLWHAPLILMGLNYPEHPQLGLLMMSVWTLLSSPIFSYIKLRSKSIFAVSIFHGTVNASPALALMCISGGNDLLTGITGLAGFIVIAAIDLFLFIYDRYLTAVPIDNLIKIPLTEESNKNASG
jgi:membrane protease YdiL (CAAX protease family)